MHKCNEPWIIRASSPRFFFFSPLPFMVDNGPSNSQSILQPGTIAIGDCNFDQVQAFPRLMAKTRSVWGFLSVELIMA